MTVSLCCVVNKNYEKKFKKTVSLTVCPDIICPNNFKDFYYFFPIKDTNTCSIFLFFFSLTCIFMYP